jgi:hypothetical protein
MSSRLRTWSSKRPSVLFAQAKELKAAGVDRSLNRIARKFVRRIPIRRDGAYRTPRFELTRQLETSQIAAKRAESGVYLGFKDENPPRLTSASRRTFVILKHIISHRRSPSSELLTPQRSTQRSSTFVLVAEDQSPFFQIVG